MRALKQHKTKQAMQDNLRMQIMEQKRLKDIQLQQEKAHITRTLQNVKRESQKAEKIKLDMRKKQMDLKEMVDKQMRAHQLQKRLNDDEKRRYEKMAVKELRLKIQEEKQKEIDKKLMQREVQARLRNDNEKIKSQMVTTQITNSARSSSIKLNWSLIKSISRITTN